MIVGVIASMLSALVRVKKALTSFDETQSKRATVAEVLAKSIRKEQPPENND